MWAATDIRIELLADATDDPVITAEIVTPAGTLRMMAEPEWNDRVLILQGCHMHGEDIGPNEFGWQRLRWLAQAAMEVLDVDEIRITGEIRTSGAHPGYPPRRSGSAARYVLKAEAPFHRTVIAAEALAKHGLTLLQAKRAVTRLANGESIAVEVPKVADPASFEQELKRLNIITERRDPPDDVNVKEIREHLGLSQDEFAMRFGFDAASLRNWEQQRTVPELAVRSFFKVIQANPVAVESALATHTSTGHNRR